MAGLWGPTVLWVGGNSKCRMRRETGGREYHSGVGGGRGTGVFCAVQGLKPACVCACVSIEDGRVIDIRKQGARLYWAEVWQSQRGFGLVCLHTLTRPIATDAEIGSAYPRTLLRAIEGDVHGDIHQTSI